MKRLSAAFLFAALLLVPATAAADIGVGVGTGKIDIQDSLQAGGVYRLPEVTVFNNGDVTSDYEMLVTLNEYQDEIKPNPGWFSFEPARFELEPGQAQAVTPYVTLPIRTEPGRYYGYLEARPVAKFQGEGNTAVGVAAATKLWFNVTPSNFFNAVYYRIAGLFKRYAPYSYIVAGTLAFIALVALIRRYTSLSISVSKKYKHR